VKQHKSTIIITIVNFNRSPISSTADTKKESPVEIPKAAIHQTPTMSVADEIKKLSNLLTEGFITQAEFEHKKRILLGL